MARYDPDLIAALAAGLLEPAEAAVLERRIAADPAAAAELAAQRLALRAFRDAPAPVLSAEERAELRRGVAAAINLEEARAAAPAPRRRFPWRPIAVAAGALAVLAALVPLVTLLSVGGDRAALTTVAETGATPRSAEEADDDVSLLGTPEPTADTADFGTEGAAAFDAELEQTAESLLSEPALLIASVDADLHTCESEAHMVLGEAVAPAAAILTRDAGDLVIWFISIDGATIEHLAVFDPDDCLLLATRP